MTPDQLKELEALNERWANAPGPEADCAAKDVMDLLPDVLKHIKQLTAERDACLERERECTRLLQEQTGIVGQSSGEIIRKLVSERDAARRALAEANKQICCDSDKLCGKCYECRLIELDATRKALRETKDGGLLLCQANEVLQSRIVERDKACAEMKDALRSFYPKRPFSSLELATVEALREHALSTDCGKGYHADSEWKPVVEALKISDAYLSELGVGYLHLTKVKNEQAIAHAAKLMETAA